jgi:hypothetical protein
MAHKKLGGIGNQLVQGVGEFAYQENWKKLVGKLQPDQEMRRKAEVYMVAEPTNKYDSTAVMLYVDNLHVGYLPKEVAAVVFHHIKPYADKGDTVSVDGTIWAVERNGDLKMNVSTYMPEDLLDGIDASMAGRRVVGLPNVDRFERPTSSYKPSREWWTFAGVAFLICLIPVVGIPFGLFVFCVGGFLITSGRFNYDKKTFWKKK